MARPIVGKWSFHFFDRIEEKGAVLGDNEVEQLKFWEDASQVWKIPSGDEDELPPGAPDFFQSLDGGHIHAAVAGQGSVVVGG